MTNFTASDCERLLATQDLLDTLSTVDMAATSRNLRPELTCPLETLITASLTVTAAGLGRVLTTIRSDISGPLRRCAPAVVDAVTHAAFAAAFSDLLDTDTVVALSLPWALAQVAVATTDDEDEGFEGYEDFGGDYADDEDYR